MALSFKERLALASQQGGHIEPKVEELPVKEPDKAPEPVAAQPTKTSRFGSPSPIAIAEPKPVEVKKEEPLNLGKVIAAHNTIANKPEAQQGGVEDVDPLSGTEAPSIVKELQQRISGLSNLGDVDLKGEVQLLKEMITVNGDACRYLMDEDLGLMVRALRRLTDNKVAIDMSRAKPSRETKAKTPTLSAADQKALLDTLDLDI